MAEKIFVADCSVGGPFDGITVRDETKREEQERIAMCSAHASRRAAVEERIADQRSAQQEIKALAEQDPDAPLSAGLVARAFGMKA